MQYRPCRRLPEHANLRRHVLQDIAQEGSAILQQVVLGHVVVRQVRPDSCVLNQVGVRIIAVQVLVLTCLKRLVLRGLAATS